MAMSNNTPILVSGASGYGGSVWRGVVKLLREHELQLRALVHHLDEPSEVLSKMGAELVIAGLTNGADLVRALRGCKRIFFAMSISPPYLQATAIAAAAAKEIPDFEILVNFSQMTVSQMTLTEMTQSIQQQQHWLGEQVLNSPLLVHHHVLRPLEKLSACGTHQWRYQHHVLSFFSAVIAVVLYSCLSL